MKFIQKLVSFIIGLSVLPVVLTACSSLKAEVKVVTEINSAQVDAIEEEFGFALPENSQILQCRLGLPRDWPFSVAISGITDVEAFIQNNLNFEVKEPYEVQLFPYEVQLFPYNAEERTDLSKTITAEYYFGLYNGSERGIYIYETDLGTIVEIEKSGVVSQELLKMFGK